VSRENHCGENRYTGSSVTVRALAKINLYLHVVGRRADGYHELESLFVFTRNGDEITVRPSEKLTLQISGPFSTDLLSEGGADENNLVLRAARALALAGDIKPGASLELVKNLPIASGIGGGSADAAATLLALNSFWGLNLSLVALSKIALTLGADVPACLHQTPLFVSGIGEIIEPVSLFDAFNIVLVNPGAKLSTPVVFDAFHIETDGHFLPKMGFQYQSGQKLGPWLKDHTSNSLQAPAVSLCPDIADALNLLETCDGAQLVRMSGSGATCFALFDDPADAEKARQSLESARPDWWVFKDSIQVVR